MSISQQELLETISETFYLRFMIKMTITHVETKQSLCCSQDKTQSGRWSQDILKSSQ